MNKTEQKIRSPEMSPSVTEHIPASRNLNVADIGQQASFLEREIQVESFELQPSLKLKTFNVISYNFS